MKQRDDGPVPEGPYVARRVMLVASGGLMLGVATALGWRPGTLLVEGDHAHAPARARPGSAAPARPARAGPAGKVGKPARVTSAQPPRQPARHPRPEPPAGVTGDPDPAAPVYYLNDGPMTIALTIDDGPSPVYTPQVLRILEKYKVKASFSMVGENVTYYPGIASEVAGAGHVIVNHTWDHANLALLTAAQAREEIARATDAIHAAVGVRPALFRAPYGAWSTAALEYCAREKLMPLDWSVDPRDWARPGVSKIIRNIMRNTRTGSIILEHDGGGDRSETVAALKVVIPRLLDQGYRFRTV